MEELPAHHSFSGPNHLSTIYRYIDLLIDRRPEAIASLNAFRLAFGKRNKRICVSISERLQKFENRAARLTPGFGMRSEADAVRTANTLDAGLRGNEGFDDLQMSQHRGGEQRRPCSFGDQILGNGPIA